jgi:KAP family P-loop domain
MAWVSRQQMGIRLDREETPGTAWAPDQQSPSAGTEGIDVARRWHRSLAYTAIIAGLAVMAGGASLYASDPAWLPAVVVGAVTAAGGIAGLLHGGRRSERAPAKEVASSTTEPSAQNVLSDAPTKNDEFGRSRYADILADVAFNAATPLVVALYGAWGSGKTSLMLQIQQRLERNHDSKGPDAPPGQRARTVWFDPWTHQFDQIPALGLLHAITGQLNLTARTEAEETLKKIALALAENIQIPYIGLQVGKLAKIRTEVADEEFRRREQQARLREYFKDILRLAGTPGTRLVVFIDDLDRCQPKRTVDVLEALKLYLDFPGCVYVLGVDRESVEAAIKSEYADLGITESSYLDKIVQLPVTLPAIGEDAMREFVKKRVPTDLEDCTEILTVAGADDPRQVKRILNALNLSHELVKPVVPEYEPQILAALILIQNFAPDLYRELRRNPPVIHDLFRDAETRTPAAKPTNGQGADAAGEDVKTEVQPTDRSPTEANLWAQYVDVRPRLAAALRSILIPPNLDLRPYLTFTAAVAAPAQAGPEKATAGHAIRFVGTTIAAGAEVDAERLQSLTLTARAVLRDSVDRLLKRERPTAKESDLAPLSELTRLAVVGYRIFSALFGSRPAGSSTGEDARRPGVAPIQLSSLTAPTPPVTVLYDHPIDTNLPFENYTLCPDFSAAFENKSDLTNTACWHGECPGYDNPSIICPSGFWGFRHALGLVLPTHTNTRARQPIQIQYTDKPLILLAFDSNIAPQHYQHMIHLAPAVYTVIDRFTLRKAMTEEKPSLIYFFTHGGEEYGFPFLTIGKGEEERIDPSFIHDAYSSNKSTPIVVINSGVGGDGIAEFARTFITAGNAAGVIGPEIPLTTHDAALFGEALISRLLDGQDAGWAVRDARLDLLKAGNPMGLAYMPFIPPEVRLERTGQ